MIIRSLRNAFRLLALARLLAHHDALFVLAHLGVPLPLWLLARPFRRHESGRPGQRLAGALHEAGPSFIKLGQALSTRSDLLGEQLAADLSMLQDRLPPFPFEQVKTIIEGELGKPLSELFASFQPEPVAAASIAQVHFAVCTDGREVAVKVLRPGVEAAFERDLDLFLWIAELAEANMPALRRLRPIDTIRTFAESVALEMDLRYEAAAAAELADNFAGDPTFHVPVIDWGRTGQRVLTTERVTGIKIDERQAILAAGHDPRAVLGKAAEAIFNQVFRDGFFHADLHAGNLFVRADGSIAAVDFGIMGRLDRKTRRFLGELLLGFLSRDYRRAAEVHFAAGWIPADRSVDAFAQACRSIAEPILDKPQHEISIARLLGQLFQITETFAMETQPQLLLLQKTMLIAEGTGRKLAPEVNMWFLARPLIETWTLRTLGPEARIRETADGLLKTLIRLPDLVRRAEESASVLASGRLRLDPESLRGLDRGSRGGILPWLLAAILATALAVVVLVG
jgi:ubiquinone biosynthesis protein